MKQIQVRLSKDHLLRLSHSKPFEALKQIIWNALDADATKIDISFEETEIDKVSCVNRIIVKDDGSGLPYAHIEANLGQYGESEKTNSLTSPRGRHYHGKLGEGRYTYFALGPIVKWISVYRNESGINQKFEIEFGTDSGKTLSCSDPEPTTEQTGLTVEIDSVTKEASLALKNKEVIRLAILKEFSPYLHAYQPISLVYDGEELQSDSFVAFQDKSEFHVGEYSFEFSAIQWNSKTESELYLCGSDSVVYFSEPLNCGVNVSAYVSSPFFDNKQHDGSMLLWFEAELGPQIKDQINGCVEAFVTNVHVREQSQFIQKLKEEGTYPYPNVVTDVVEKQEQKIFDVVATEFSKHAPKTLLKSDKKTQTLTWQLFNEALKTNPSNLRKILAEIFKLSKAEQDDLASLLEKTTLSHLIQCSKEVSDRISFLEELEKIVYDEAGDYVKERIEFQPLLLKQIWVFGEQYRLGVADVNLRNVLKKYCSDLGLSDIEISDEDKTNPDMNKIPDIVLWNNQGDGTRFENLVVEIKKPHKILGEKECSQIMHYANSIVQDKRFFETEKTTWRFILIGEGVDSYLENTYLSGKKDNIIAGGLDQRFYVQVMTWSKLIEEEKLKYSYLKQKMDLTLTDEQLDKRLNERWEAIRQTRKNLN